MLGSTSVERVYLACGTTDLRKSIDGLAVIVQECFNLDPFSPSLFVFCNRKRDKLKILNWKITVFGYIIKDLNRAYFIGPLEIMGHQCMLAIVNFVGCLMVYRLSNVRLTERCMLVQFYNS